MNRPSSPRLARLRPWVAVAFGIMPLGCDGSSKGTVAGPVPSGSFALVGTHPLAVEVLRRTAETRAIEQASAELVSDSRLALESAATRPERAAVVERGVLVRGLIESLREETLRAAPPRAEELDAAAAALWAQLERPRCVRTVNIMAEVPPLAEGTREQVVLRRIAEEVRGAPTPEELNRRVQKASKDGVEVVVLLMPPVTEDGRIYVETPADAGHAPPPIEYARAAASLTHVGETTDVVATPSGYHVLMALDILPPLVLGEPSRSLRLAQAVADQRIGSKLAALREDAAVRATVWQSPRASSFTSLVWRALSGP